MSGKMAWATVPFLILLIVFCYFFFGNRKVAENPVFGVNFSQKHAHDLGIEWRENYLALLDDLKVDHFKIITHWDLLERERDKFSFDDLDWQIEQAEERDAKVILVVGIKTGRWPECHLPDWAKGLSKEEQQQEVLDLTRELVLRYKDSDAVWAWQVENEPFFPFGECQWSDEEFVKKEIGMVRSLSPDKPIVFGDSGEGSFWFHSAQLGDIVGITMYKWVWFSQFERYVYYPLPPVFYGRKAQLISFFFQKPVIVIELQAEPWGPKLLYDVPLEEQKKTMNLEQFKYNVNFARQTGLKEFYLWGSEWWYWLKEIHNQPEIWEEARDLWL
ncbi:MAG: cellulase family glycosylhydrolase [Candidatus Nealsonbacteria bacterium]|nr:cellulase family glycosylhydrolase [Candidatus Nealsonbacteria bacterium]